MLKKTIKYTDYNGIERTESFYFNLNKAELMKMELGTAGGLAEQLQKIVDAQDAPTIMDKFEWLLKKSYGEKTEDGRGFVKSEEAYQRFVQTEAYSIIFMELATDAKKAAEFIDGIMPADLSVDKANHPALQ